MFKKLSSAFIAFKNALSSGNTANTKDITNQWFPSHYFTGSNTSGEVVNTGNALTLSTVWACVNVISQDISKVPFYCDQKTEEGKNRVHNNISYLLNYRPNPYMSAMDFRQCLTAHALTSGNGYAEIVKDTKNEITALYPLPPEKVKLKIYEGSYIYEVRSGTQTFYLYPEEIIHIKGLGNDGLNGYSVISFAAQSLGTALATEKFAGSFFGNGSTMGGYLEHPQNLSAQAEKNLKDSIEAGHKGVDKAHRLLLLEEGMKYKEAGINNKDSQFLESRQFSIPQICQWFRISPIKVGDYSRATFSNVEQLSIDYVGDTLTGWFRKWEQECWYKLLSPEQKEQGYFVEHVIEGLLRGDIETRYSAYSVGRQWGWLSVNEIRERENMNKVEGGDTYITPLNMENINATPEDKGELSKFSKDIAERIGKTELKELDKQLLREDFDNEKFNSWTDKFYAKHFEYISKTLSVTGKEIIPSTYTLYSQLKAEEDKRGYFINIKNTYIEHLQEKINELFK